jgi:hypothetical protein
MVLKIGDMVVLDRDKRVGYVINPELDNQGCIRVREIWCEHFTISENTQWHKTRVSRPRKKTRELFESPLWKAMNETNNN